MDFLKAKQIFNDYLTQYDLADDKIRLKVIHTQGVIKAARFLSDALALEPVDRDLASIIALLHDIGRFEQLKRYNSFDDSIMPHAQCSLDILFRDGMISKFLSDRQYDIIIYEAIKNHGIYKMAEGLEGKTLLHSQLIRDADKLDNFRVKAESDMCTMVDVAETVMGEEPITDSIYDTFLSHTPILNSDRKTHMDMWLSYLAYMFDLNFPESLAYIKEQGYVDILIDRIPYTNPDTRLRMEIIRNTCHSYIADALSKQSNNPLLT